MSTTWNSWFMGNAIPDTENMLNFVNLQIIPEPTTLSLLALGALLAGRKRRK
jgi:hypothetical protein